MGGVKKEYEPLPSRGEGPWMPVLCHAIKAFLDPLAVDAVAVVVPSGDEDFAERLCRPIGALLQAVPCRFVGGGATRQESTYKGLMALEPYGPTLVMVHDGARPFPGARLIAEVLASARAHGAAIPAAPLVETVKAAQGGFVAGHPAREGLASAQTPQCFPYRALLGAHAAAATGRARAFTDDAELYAETGGKIAIVPSDALNVKITFAEDLARLRGASRPLRIGSGWDLHRLVEGRPLMIGGLRIESERGEDGHSDGDALCHALIDALLGAACMADIGAHFPPGEPEWRGADSLALLRRVAAMLRDAGFVPVNVDCTVVLESPRLRPHIDTIRESLAGALGIAPGAVSVKAKSAEGLGPVGLGEAIEAYASALVEGLR
jgi:2-C-methyl-D-erythritol 4-phosphate cytidylyltransferase/2-C-methyl-D-erythritol 2,4-cyclodiphosphate synthase